MIYPLVISHSCEIENGPVEIVDFATKRMVIFQFANCKRLPEGTPSSLDG